MRAPLLVYTHPQRFFFVAKDIEALRGEYHVLEHSFSSGNSLMLPWDLLRQAVLLPAESTIERCTYRDRSLCRLSLYATGDHGFSYLHYCGGQRFLFISEDQLRQFPEKGNVLGNLIFHEVVFVVSNK